MILEKRSTSWHARGQTLFKNVKFLLDCFFFLEGELVFTNKMTGHPMTGSGVIPFQLPAHEEAQNQYRYQ